MPSIFSTKTGLRHRYVAKTAAELSTALSKATAVLFETASQPYRLSYFDNATDKDLMIAVVHPEMDASVLGNRVEWFEIPTNRVLNFGEMQLPNAEIDAGTKIYVWSGSGVATTTGKFRVIFWG